MCSSGVVKQNKLYFAFRILVTLSSCSIMFVEFNNSLWNVLY